MHYYTDNREKHPSSRQIDERQLRNFGELHLTKAAEKTFFWLKSHR